MTDERIFDSIIFDMDGTLWDAVDSYCEIWNRTIAQCGIIHSDITRDDLIAQMGTPLAGIVKNLISEAACDRRFIDALDRNEIKLMPLLGGRLYPGVREIIPELSSRYRLFMVSNCSAHTLTSFLDYTKLRQYFADWLSYGETHCDKAENIVRLVSEYELKSPLYVGDTAGDESSSEKAGVRFAFAAYGFGHADYPEFTLSEFSDLKKLLL